MANFATYYYSPSKQNVIPSIGNEVINLVKDTSLVYVIGLGELLRAGDVTPVPLVLVGIIYLLMTGIASFVF